MAEPIRHHKFWSKERLIRIIRDLHLQEHKKSILSELWVFGLQTKIIELEHRIDNYEDIVLCEV